MENGTLVFKIIFVGSVHGKFRSLFQKMESINNKHGPFEAMLCPGRLFGDDNSEWEDVLSGKLQCPIPFLVLGPQNDSEVPYYQNTDSATFEGLIAPKIYCLGLNGIHVTASGLQIAFISFSRLSDGTYGISKDNINRILEHLKATRSFRGVDFFLSPLWPSGVLNRLPDNKLPQCFQSNDDVKHGDEIISKLASILRPRYHLCVWDSDESIYYQRSPYRNFPLYSLTLQHLAYFVSLGAFKNQSFMKDIFAFKISPLLSMPYKDLCFGDSEISENPYPRLPSTDPTECCTSLICSDPNDSIEFIVSPEQSYDCWFCLSNPNIQKHMIFFVACFNYLTVAKGGLVPYHVLICPISHVSSLSALDHNSYKELTSLKNSVERLFHSEGKSVVIFERNYHSQHLQLQIIPIPKQNPAFLADVFIRHGKKYQMHFTELPPNKPLSDSVSSVTPYFYIELEGGIRLLHVIRGKIPIQFGREVLASPQVLALHPDRVDWKNCQLNIHQETLQAKELEIKIKPFL